MQPFCLVLAYVMLSGCAVLASDTGTISCQLADAGTTAIALNRGAREANPLIAHVIAKAGLPMLVLLKAAEAWALVTFVLPERSTFESSARATINVGTCGVAVQNMGVMLR